MGSFSVALLDHPALPGHHADMLIYKILRADEWADLQAQGQTSGAPVDVADGYIHFSTDIQARETAAKHFAGEGDLMIAAFETDRMADALKWDESRGGALFPHYYGSMTLDHVVWAQPLPLTDNGHLFPENFA